MRNLFFLFITLISFNIHASNQPEQWLCTSQGISRTGQTFESCGAGEGPSETLARSAALQAAMDEFNMICKASADCDVKRVSIRPKRMSCTGYSNGMWKCYRLIEVLIGQ